MLGLLGQGGAGAVYRCLAPTGQHVAVKLPHLYTPEDTLRFQRECRLQQELGGEGLLPLLAAGHCALGHYAVLPLAEGGTLQDRLRLGPLPWTEAVPLVRRVAEVAGRMHAAGVVHRDLKPDNVLLTEAGEPWVADLGLSKHSDRTRDARSVSFSQSGAFAGTPGYMAPEQMFDAKSVGPAADVFALGAILYAALTGREPFAAATAAGCLKKSTAGDYVLLGVAAPDTPAWVVDAVQRALSSEPEERPLTGADFAARLVQPVALPSVRRPVSWAWVGWLAGLLTVGALSIGLLWALRGVPTEELPPQAPQALPAKPSPQPEQLPSPPDEPDSQGTAVEPAPPTSGELRAEAWSSRWGAWSVGEPEGVLDSLGGHLGLLRTIALDLEHDLVFTGSQSGNLSAWQASNGRLLDVRNAGAPVIGVALGRDRQVFLLTSTGEFGKVQGAALRRFASGHPSGADLHSNGEGWLVSCGSDGARFWSPDHQPTDPAPALVASGALSVARFRAQGGGIALGAQGAWRWTEPGVGEWVEAGPAPGAYEDLGWTPDGTRLITLSGDNVLSVYSWPGLEALASRSVWTRPAGAPGYLNTRGLCVAADGQRVWTVGIDTRVRAWSLPDLQPAGSWEPGWAPWTECLRQAPDGTWFAGGNASQLLRFSPTGQPLWPLRLRVNSWIEGQGKQVTRVHTQEGLAWLDSAGTQLLLNSDTGLEVLNVKTGERLVHRGTPRVAGGERLAIAGERVFRILQGRLEQFRVRQAEGRFLFEALGPVGGEQGRGIRFRDVCVSGGEVYALGSTNGGAKLQVFVCSLEGVPSRQSPALEVGAARARFGQALGGGLQLIYGAQRAQLWDLTRPSVQPASDEPLLGWPLLAAHVGQAWSLTAYRDRIHVFDATRDPSPRTLAIKHPLIACTAWRSGIAYADSGSVTFFDLQSHARVERHVFNSDVAQALILDPAGASLYAWTARGRVYRFPIRR